jgi:hypothetical protein
MIAATARTCASTGPRELPNSSRVNGSVTSVKITGSPTGFKGEPAKSWISCGPSRDRRLFSQA